jgi:VanZ family protein
MPARCWLCLAALLSATAAVIAYFSVISPYPGDDFYFLSLRLDHILRAQCFGLVTVLAALLWSPLIFAVLLALSYSIFSEFVQLYVPGRQMSLFDLACSVAGICGGVIVFLVSAPALRRISGAGARQR